MRNVMYQELSTQWGERQNPHGQVPGLELSGAFQLSIANTSTLVRSTMFDPSLASFHGSPDRAT
jgi:hypothetical protein